MNRTGSNHLAAKDGEHPDIAAWQKVQRWQELSSLLHEGRFTLAQLVHRLTERGHPLSVRTLQRDLSALSLLLGEEIPHTPGPKSGRGFFLSPDQHPIPLLNLTPGEARSLLFAVRLLVHNSREHEHDTRTLLEKLASAFPGIIGTVAAQTIAQIDSLPREHRASRDSRDLTLLQLTRAWTRGSLVTLSYRGVGSPRVSHNWCFQPLLLEPSRSNGGAYVIGFRFGDASPRCAHLPVTRLRLRDGSASTASTAFGTTPKSAPGQASCTTTTTSARRRPISRNSSPSSKRAGPASSSAISTTRSKSVSGAMPSIAPPKHAGAPTCS